MNRALILMYHAVDSPRAPSERRLCVPPSSFARQMRVLLDDRYCPVPLHTLVAALTTGAPLPSNAVALTFDDGFSDVYHNALPVLHRHGIPATLFAVTKHLGGVNAWMSGNGVPQREILGATELRMLQDAGVEIGSHTVSHPSMVDLNVHEAVREAAASKEILEQMLGRAVRYFAYPYGRFNATVKEAVRKAGYEAACSTKSGFNSSATDLYELRRIDVFGSDSLAHFRRKLALGANAVSFARLLTYYAGRAMHRLNVGAAH